MNNISKLTALLLTLALLLGGVSAAMAEGSYNINSLTEEQYQEIIDLYNGQIVIPDDETCECTDADGNRVCAEDCACQCHAPVEEELSEEILAWIAEMNPTEEMIERAKKASSLDVLYLDGDALYHVRTGEKIATYDPATGDLTDCATGLRVANVHDMMKTTAAAAE